MTDPTIGVVPGAKAELNPELEPLTDSEILLPNIEVRLANGRRVLIKPWGLTDGRLLWARIENLMPAMTKAYTAEKAAGGEGLMVSTIIDAVWDDALEICRITIGMTREQFEAEVIFEDFQAILAAVLEVCIVRADGGGVLPKMLGLTRSSTSAVTRVIGPMLADSRLTPSKPQTPSRPNGAGESKARRRTGKKRKTRRKPA